MEQAMPRSPASSLLEAIESFFRHNHDLKPLTRRTYRGSLRRFSSFIAGGRIEDVTADTANAYIASVSDHRYMARGDAAVLRVFSKWLVRARILDLDPLVGVATPRVPRSRPKPYEAKVVRQIVSAAAQTRMGPRDRALVLLALATGARPNELRQLRWPQDVDLGAGVVRIREETSKSAAGHREIPLDPQVIAVLDEYVRDYRPNLPGPLFLNARGGPLTYYGFMAIHARLRDRLRDNGVEGYQAYRNRHTGITNFARTPGMTLSDVQYLAGHEDPTTTRGYIQSRTIAQLRALPSAFTQAYGRVV